MSNEKATFGAGCFWGVELRFRQLPGVLDAAVGYMGGTLDQPRYEDVCTGTTMHAEVVQVEFDPTQISFEALVEFFWVNHDPTQHNRQGPDVGTQYRSVIFYHDDEQHTIAEASKRAWDASGKLPAPIATTLEPAGTFWRAEEYHQRYLERRGPGGCSIQGST